MPTIRKILIANRGEIAVRIAQAAHEMGMEVVAVYSDADRDAPHVHRADVAVSLAADAPADTYLNAEKILEAAQAHAVDAIHPGYGFLSENAAFARACADRGVVFVGPSPEAIEAMGDKTVARKLMADAHVPIIDGWSGEGEVGVGEAAAAADRIGFPVLIKAAAGGGGRGMRIVRDAGEFASAFGAAAREATAAFGDGRLFVEKYIDKPRHVEFQIFGDGHGNVVHLFDRECSIQRRYQKIIEESPSPALDDELRRTMGGTAVRAAKAIGYGNAGTVEFIVDESGRFYFLEVNTRLQVEHPVTEMVTGLDLIRLQFLVASGAPLPFDQAGVRQAGHAIECRIYAEDPARGFAPSAGRLERFSLPHGAHVRVDTGVAPGSVVSVHYDPMLAKLIVAGGSRGEAIDRMRWALGECVVLGVRTNLEFLRRVIEHEAFRVGRLHTHLLDELNIESGQADPPAEAFAAAAVCAASLGHRSTPDGTASPATAGATDDLWACGRRWSNV